MLPKKKPNPSSRACLSCRDKHLKCDGQLPICARCTAAGLPCVFIESRRGHRPAVPKGQPTALTRGLNLDSSALNIQQVQIIPSGKEPQAQRTQQNSSSSEETTSIIGVDYNIPGDDHLIGLYYQYIHPAHPFILPQKLFRRNPSIFPDHLRNAICFIASHHSPNSLDRAREPPVAVLGYSVPDDGFKVQSLILLTLASYARFERDQGNQALSGAVDLARRIGIDSDAFGQGYDPVYRESWRRTWWELYTITGLISLIGGTMFRLPQPARMTLPTSCEGYNACLVSDGGTNIAIQQRFSAESSFEWSSFAYRIEAMRILSMVLDITDELVQSRPDATESAISSFLLSLPASKRDGLQKNGEVDEVMSCALMIIHLASICLHLPRSTLARLRGFRTVCGTDGGTPMNETSTYHDAAALRSAKALSKLLTSRSTLATLSPCFSCAIAFAAVVQLPAYLVQQPPESDYLKEYIQLELSALQHLGETWPIARVVRSQIAQFSREIICPQQAVVVQQQPMQQTMVPSSERLPTPVSSMPGDQWLNDLLGTDFGFTETTF